MRAGSIALAVGIAGVPVLAHAGTDEIELLVYTRTTGFRHDSIPAGIAAVQQIADARGWVVVATEDPLVFDPVMLAEYEVVVFLSTTGDVLDDVQQSALQGWVQAGGGFVGIHSASNTEEDWPWFVGLLGGTTFADHPAQQMATVHVANADHPSTMGLPDPWMRFDEWYNFDAQPAATVDVLLLLDETTYEGGTMGRQHPIAWAHEYDGGRSFYTGLGHTIESWTEPEFLAHVEGGIAWVAEGEPVGADSSTGADAGSDSGGLDTTGSVGTSDAGETTTAMPGSSGMLDDASGSAADDSAGTSSSAGASETTSDGGCGCTATPGSSALVFLVLPVIRRRRGTRAAARSPS